jgi:hypothetical protein
VQKENAYSAPCAVAKSIRKSSICFPDLSCAANRRGFFPERTKARPLTLIRDHEVSSFFKPRRFLVAEGCFPQAPILGDPLEEAKTECRGVPQYPGTRNQSRRETFVPERSGRAKHANRCLYAVMRVAG